jgi:NAD(P)H-dependent FMN reductase
VSAPLRVMAVVGTTRSVSKTKALVELIISRLAAHADISAEVTEIHALTPASAPPSSASNSTSAPGRRYARPSRRTC